MSGGTTRPITTLSPTASSTAQSPSQKRWLRIGTSLKSIPTSSATSSGQPSTMWANQDLPTYSSVPIKNGFSSSHGHGLMLGVATSTSQATRSLRAITATCYGNVLPLLWPCVHLFPMASTKTLRHGDGLLKKTTGTGKIMRMPMPMLRKNLIFPSNFVPKTTRQRMWWGISSTTLRHIAVTLSLSMCIAVNRWCSCSSTTPSWERMQPILRPTRPHSPWLTNLAL